MDRTQRALCAIGSLSGYIFVRSRLTRSHHTLTAYLGNKTSAQRQRRLITQCGDQVNDSFDLRDSNQVKLSTCKLWAQMSTC